MKIERKIILSNTVYLLLILIIGGFAVQALNSVSNKQRFLEIADDLNASFLTMRLSEKNYFLFNDDVALNDIQNNIAQAGDVMDSVRGDIVPVIGEQSYDDLRNGLNDYAAAINQASINHARDQQTADKIREKGRSLEETSNRIIQLERSSVSDIITRSKWLLFSSFFAVLVAALIASRSVTRKILGPIKQIERLARSISAGNFKKIETPMPKDEFGPVIDAINSMSEELEEREEELIQSRKLASIGVLVAGVAHELNNPVNNISMIAQTYDDMYQKLTEEQRIEFMRKVDQESERIKGIVTNLLDFARPKEPKPRETDINALVGKALVLVKNTLTVSSIETRFDLAEGLPQIFIDDNQVQQVFVNLFLNAAQAMAPGGRLFVSTRLQPDESMVDIIIRDTGKGIQPEYLPNIFDPFFSTKEEGGTGLGLSVSYGIIKNHGGNIKVESRPGIGTTFTIQLPVNNLEKGKI
ncbi:MAG: HAMP domain-containing protein [Thermoleophilia bacterium]|nr:HAMP domain-containing protein [Thermoleophilia bacterium]